MKISATVTIVAALLALPACDGGDKNTTSDEGTTTGGATDASATDASATDTPTGDATTTPGELSFAVDVWEPIMKPICTCHAVAGSGGLVMGEDATTAFSAMVGVKAVGAPALDRILAGDSSKSYVINKLQGTQVEAGGAGNKMPLQGSITTDQIQTIVDWIDAGAKP